jgi:hypothetical protein
VAVVGAPYFSRSVPSSCRTREGETPSAVAQPVLVAAGAAQIARTSAASPAVNARMVAGTVASLAVVHAR